MRNQVCVVLDHFRRRSIGQEVAAAQKEGSLAELLDNAHRVAYQDDGDAPGPKLLHLGEALLLEGGVAHGEDLVD